MWVILPPRYDVNIKSDHLGKGPTRVLSTQQVLYSYHFLSMCTPRPAEHLIIYLLNTYILSTHCASGIMLDSQAIKMKKINYLQVFPGGPAVKDPCLSLLWLLSQLWHRFTPWPRNFCKPRVQPKKKKNQQKTPNHFDSSHFCGNWEVEDPKCNKPGPVFLPLQKSLCRNHNINNLQWLQGSDGVLILGVGDSCADDLPVGRVPI